MRRRQGLTGQEPGGGADVKVEQGAGEEDVEAAVGRTNDGSDKHCRPLVT